MSNLSIKLQELTSDWYINDKQFFALKQLLNEEILKVLDEVKKVSVNPVVHKAVNQIKERYK